MLRSTKCDAVMIGRGALRTPHLFRQVAGYLADGTMLPPQTFEERARTVRDHAEMLVADKGPGEGMKWVRRFLPFYMQDFKGPVDFDRLVKGVTRMSELNKVLEHIGAMSRTVAPRHK